MDSGILGRGFEAVRVMTLSPDLWSPDKNRQVDSV